MVVHVAADPSVLTGLLDTVVQEPGKAGATS
jgi:hypothetical protein